MRNILGPFGDCAAGRTGRTVRTTLLMSGLATALITAAHAQYVTWLGALPGGYESWAYGVSDNGVVVGRARNASGYDRAFRWENGVMQDLGKLGGHESRAFGVSADGSVVVGGAWNASQRRRAVRWTSSGIEDLNTIAIGLSQGSKLVEAYAISPNGRYIVGTGYNASTGRTEAWVMDLQVGS